MPTAKVNGQNLNYEDTGSGEPVIFLHGLTFSARMWDAQVKALSKRYRCINADFRGHGGTPPSGEFTLEDLAEDAHGLIAQLGVAPAHVVGLSMGGMVAMRLALAYPGDVRSLVLLDTSADPELPERAPQYEMLANIAREQGLGAVLDAVLPIFFAPRFLARTDEVNVWRERLAANDREGVYQATLAVARRSDISVDIRRISAPTLVVVGELDDPTPLEKHQAIRDAIVGSELAVIPGSGHMSPLEAPGAVTEAIERFLARVGAPA